jgi:hypothetical protein
VDGCVFSSPVAARPPGFFAFLECLMAAGIDPVAHTAAGGRGRLALAFGIGTTTVGICVGAGLLERARRVTLVCCVLSAATFGALGVGVAASGYWIAERFTHADKVVAAAGGYFRVTGPVYGFMVVATV